MLTQTPDVDPTALTRCETLAVLLHAELAARAGVEFSDPLAGCGRLVAEFAGLFDEPRIPKGQSGGGEWTTGGGGASPDPFAAFKKPGPAQGVLFERRTGDAPKKDIDKDEDLRALSAVRRRDPAAWDMPQELKHWQGGYYLTHLPTGKQIVSVRGIGDHEYHVKDRAGSLGKTLRKFRTADEAADFVEGEKPAPAVAHESPRPARPGAGKLFDFSVPSDDHLAGCGRLVEFYDPDQPRVPSGNQAGGQWMDAGGNPPGKGGQPLYVKDGRVTHGHPSLAGKEIESLSHRAQLKSSRAAARADWGKQATYHGHKPEALHQLAAELMAHDKASIADRTEALKSARSAMREFGGHAKTFHFRTDQGHDHASIPGFDTVAETLARQYPHLFPDQERQHVTDRLSDLLTAGNPRAMSEGDAYGQAMEHLDGARKQARADKRSAGGGRGPRAKAATYEDDVPFTRTVGE